MMKNFRNSKLLMIVIIASFLTMYHPAQAHDNHSESEVAQTEGLLDGALVEEVDVRVEKASEGEELLDAIREELAEARGEAEEHFAEVKEEAGEKAGSLWDRVVRGATDAKDWLGDQWDRLFKRSQACPAIPGQQCPVSSEE